VTIWPATRIAQHSRCPGPARPGRPRGPRDKRHGYPGQRVLTIVAAITVLVSHNAASARQKEMIVRISEIQIHPNHLEEYTAILKEEAEASVRVEPGVVAIFPMYQKENPTEFRILEIYASRAAYESHVKTPHFQRYKTTTLKMVKSLKLVDMEPIDPETMARMFGRMGSGR
jgi:quinol monooxygenase YgiN